MPPRSLLWQRCLSAEYSRCVPASACHRSGAGQDDCVRGVAVPALLLLSGAKNPAWGERACPPAHHSPMYCASSAAQCCEPWPCRRPARQAPWYMSPRPGYQYVPKPARAPAAHSPARSRHARHAAAGMLVGRGQQTDLAGAFTPRLHGRRYTPRRHARLGRGDLHAASPFYEHEGLQAATLVPGCSQPLLAPAPSRKFLPTPVSRGATRLRSGRRPGRSWCPDPRAGQQRSSPRSRRRLRRRPQALPASRQAPVGRQAARYTCRGPAARRARAPLRSTRPGRRPRPRLPRRPRARAAAAGM